MLFNSNSLDYEVKVILKCILDLPPPIDLVMVDSNPQNLDVTPSAIEINEFFLQSGRIIEESSSNESLSKLNQSSLRIEKHIGVITGKFLTASFAHADQAIAFSFDFVSL